MTVRDAIDDAEAVAVGGDAREVGPAARQAAFQQLARLRLEPSYRLARVILGDAAEAEDATHDAFVQAWQRWPSLRDPLRLEAWFDRILLNTCRNHLRRRRRRAVIDISEELHPRRRDPAIESLEDRDLIGAALRGMTADDRTILALRFYLDLTVDDIALRLSLRSGTVKSRLHYALRRLQHTLDESGTGGLT